MTQSIVIVRRLRQFKILRVLDQSSFTQSRGAAIQKVAIA